MTTNWIRQAGAAALIAVFSCVSVAEAKSKTKKVPASIGKIVNVSGRVLVRSEKYPKRKAREVKVGAKLYEGDVINTPSNGKVKLLMTDKSILDLGPTTLFKVDEYKLKNVSNRNVKFSMKYGKIRAAVNRKIGKGGKYRVRTNNATMGVRGTEFLVKVDPVTALEAVKPEKPDAAGNGNGPKKPAQAKVATEVQVLEGKVATVPNTEKESDAAIDRKLASTSDDATLKAGQKVVAESVVVETKEGVRSIASTPTRMKVETMSETEMKTAVAEVKIDDSTFRDAVVVASDDPKGPKGPDQGPSNHQGLETLGDIANEMNNEFNNNPDQFAFNPSEMGLPPGLNPFDPNNNEDLTLDPNNAGFVNVTVQIN